MNKKFAWWLMFVLVVNASNALAEQTKVVKFQYQQPSIIEQFILPAEMMAHNMETHNANITQNIYNYFVSKISEIDKNKFVILNYDKNLKNMKISFNPLSRPELGKLSDGMTDVIERCVHNIANHGRRFKVLMAVTGYGGTYKERDMSIAKEEILSLVNTYKKDKCINVVPPPNSAYSIDKDRLSILVKAVLTGDHTEAIKLGAGLPTFKFFEEFIQVFGPFFSWPGDEGGTYLSPFVAVQVFEIGNIFKQTSNKYFINDDVLKKYKDTTFASYIDFMKIIRKDQPGLSYSSFITLAKFCMDAKIEGLFKPFNYNKCLANNKLDEYIFNSGNSDFNMIDVRE